MKFVKPFINFLLIPFLLIWSLRYKPVMQGLAFIEFIKLSVEVWLTKLSSKGLIGFPILIVLILSVVSCKKQDEFLDATPNVHLSVIRSLSDASLLLNNEDLFNRNEPGLHLITGEEFSTTDAFYQGFQPIVQNAFVWAKNIYPSMAIGDWDVPYKQIYTSNVVLDATTKIGSESQQAEYDRIRGEALFFRARAYFWLMQQFSLPYDSASAGNDLGVPLRLSSDINIPSSRASVKECFDQIIKDLEESTTLLPQTHVYITRPTKVASEAMLAKVYLYMGAYTEALTHSNNSLQMYSVLTDYNTLIKTTLAVHDGDYLAEDIFHATPLAWIILVGSRKVVDTALFNRYDSNDLRKTLFYSVSAGRRYFSGSYDVKNFALYEGIATDEIYLIRAECNARLGNLQKALDDINLLLRNRYVTNTFTDITSNDPSFVLDLVLLERRKELTFRGVRWGDLKRLNRDPRFAVTLNRTALGVPYTLPPGDLRYAFLLPDLEIQLTGMQQNAR